MDPVADLERRLSTPSPGLVEDLRALDGDLLVLGAGGKLGPSLVTLAARALDAAGTGHSVTAVSRFGEPGVADSLRAAGAEVIAADVGDAEALRRLPSAPNVVFLVGAKFGTVGAEAATWHTNTFLPGLVAERFAGSRIVALSTGNVYPLVPTGSGATERTPPDPVGEYAMSCLGRERVLSSFAARHDTPMALIRLNYAVDLRYGVLVDIGSALLAGDPVDVTMGHVNVVWQGYANEVILRSLRHAGRPPFVLNLTGPELVSVRQAAEDLGRLLSVTPRLVGEEAPTALLSDATRCHALFGYPSVPLGSLVEQVARWLADGNPLLSKPTSFQRRDGRF